MESYLQHYGVAGQKWGVRRYQNEDGTLTAEGRERYGHLQDRGDSGFIKKYTFGSEGGHYAFAKWRERRHDKNLAKAKVRAEQSKASIDDQISQFTKAGQDAKKRGDTKNQEFFEGLVKDFENIRAKEEARRQKKIDKYESKKAAQGTANRNLDAYRRHSSTAKLVVQNAAFSTVGGNAYRHARARGESRLSAFAETAMMGIPFGALLRMTRDKKAYGKYIVYSGLDETGYFGNVIDR